MGQDKGIEKENGEMRTSLDSSERGTIMAYRSELFGIAAIWIILLHINRYVSLLPMNTLAGKILSVVFENGNSGVDVFLFLSAIGLMQSMKQNTIEAFYTHRLRRILPPFLLCGIVFFGWYDFVAAKDGAGGFLLNITSANYWISPDTYPLWYVAFILIAYAVFPFLFFLHKKTKTASTCVILLALACVEYYLFRTGNPLYRYEIVLSRTFPFLLGMIALEWPVLTKEIVTGKALILTVIGFSAVCATYLIPLPQMLQRYLITVFAVCGCACYASLRRSKFSKIGKFFAFFGSVSFELYLTHVLLIQIVKSYNLWEIAPPYIWYLIIPGISLGLSYLLFATCRRMNALILKL